MKKILAFLTVLTAIFCTACDNKQDNINDNPPVGDITSAVSETDISEDKSENTKTTSNVSQDKGESKENSDIPDDSDDDSDSSAELKHYTVSDFNEIKVNLNVQETAPPVEFKEYDLSGIVFEAKKSPCTLPENVKIENICPISEASAQQMKMGYEEYCQQFLEFYEPILEAENKPLILYTAFDGENLYYLADYDIPCPRVSHNFEIFKYNPETKENTCIYEYSDGKEGITIADIKFFDDSLWLITVENEDSIESEPEIQTYRIKTYRIDETSGKINEDVFENEINVDFIADSHSNSYKLAASVSYSEESDIRMEKENRKITAYTDKIKLETGINKCTPALFTDKKMCFLQADSDVSMLHTFDFEKMEKYTTNFGTADAKRAYQLGNNVLVHYVGSQKCIYFIPELGAGFVLQDIEKVSSPFGINYNATDTSVNVYGDKLAVANFDIGMYRDFYANNILLRDIYPPVEKDPLQKLYIFETN
ncbi:MAG: hypothetical protein J6A57_03895 [Ruminococcus sp.]|nr:hypothetical protein [Ruminococcus sp.]